MHNYSTNPETLLLLAWCSMLDLPALLQKDQQARPHKYPVYRDGWLPVFPEDMLSEQITEALCCFQGGTYDPVFLHLVKYRLLLVSIENVAAAIGLKDKAQAWHGLFYSDDPFLGSTADANETDAFLQAISKHAASQEHMRSQSLAWHGNVCEGAHALGSFFPAYSRMMLGHRDVPFFIAEFLKISLQQIDWHTIAARTLGKEAPLSCQCSSLQDEAAIPLFGELLALTGEEIRRASRRLPDQFRGPALFLSGLCRDMAGLKLDGTSQRNAEDSDGSSGD